MARMPENEFRKLKPSQKGDWCYKIAVDVIYSEAKRREKEHEIQKGVKIQFYEIMDDESLSEAKRKNKAVLFLKMRGFTWKDGQRWLEERRKDILGENEDDKTR